MNLPETTNLALNVRRRSMQRRVCVTAWLAGIAVLGILLHGGSPARASGIVVTGGGIKKFGDPYYYYIIELYLDPNSQFELGDKFTLESLGGVQYPASTTGSPGGNTGDPSGPWATTFTNLGTENLPNYSPPTPVPYANLTYINALNVAKNEGTGEEYLGQFEVLTGVSLPVLPDSYFVDVNWTASLHNLAGDAITETGTVVLHIIVPEPASVILLGVGVSLPIVWQIRRRRQARRLQQV